MSARCMTTDSGSIGVNRSFGEMYPIFKMQIISGSLLCDEETINVMIDAKQPKVKVDVKKKKHLVACSVNNNF